MKPKTSLNSEGVVYIPTNNPVWCTSTKSSADQLGLFVFLNEYLIFHKFNTGNLIQDIDSYKHIEFHMGS